MIALATTSIAWLLVLIITIGYIVYYVLNNRAARDELGSEIELAPNRKPYYDDDTLETKRLDRVLGLGVALLALTVIALPVYWVFEPTRLAGAREAQDETFVRWGGRLYATTADGGFNCAGCHGATGGGGVAPFNIADAVTGDVQEVTWVAPALNTIFYRYSDDEVRFILEYGRPFSPMSPWGLRGGGPMNDQQIDTLIAYMRNFQIEREGCAEGEGDPRSCASGHLPSEMQAEIDAAANKAVADGEAGSYGEALYNLSLGSGAYSCARCHTPGWSWGDSGVAGQGALGPNLTGGRSAEVFPNEEDMVAFIKNGSALGARYGVQGQGSGRMPGFGSTLTDEQIRAIVEYVRSL